MSIWSNNATVSPAYPSTGNSTIVYAPPAGTQQMIYNNTGTPGVVQPVVVTVQPLPLVKIFGRVPEIAKCPHCNQDVTTKTDHKISKFCVFLVCFMGCVFPPICLCSWLPCVMKDCKDVEHKCPQCEKVVGISNVVTLGHDGPRHPRYY